MGCHTWFYKKIDSPSDDEVKKNILERCNEEIDFLNRLVNDRESIDEGLLHTYPEWTPEFGESEKEFWLNLKDSIETNTITQEEIYDYYTSWSEDLIEYVEGKGFYVECGDFHDVFRRYGYPEDQLFSLEESLEYINSPINDCTVNVDTIERLKVFWDKYPDGLIEFG